LTPSELSPVRLSPPPRPWNRLFPSPSVLFQTWAITSAPLKPALAPPFPLHRQCLVELADARLPLVVVPNRFARSQSINWLSIHLSLTRFCCGADANLLSASLAFLHSSLTDDANRPMLSSTTEASLASIVTKPSRDVGASYGEANNLVSTRKRILKRHD
jgi:hypothetical protein